MRKSLAVLILSGLLLAVAVTTVFAVNPAAESIPDVESMAVPANEAAGENPRAAVPPPAAGDGLATAEAAGPSAPTGNPADGIPAVESIAVPANEAAGESPPAAVPPPAAADGLATAEAAVPAGPTGNPAAGDTPAVVSISVPAADAAEENPPSAAPADGAAEGLAVAAASITR